MKKLIGSLTIVLLGGCSTGPQIETGDSTLNALVNTPIAIYNAEQRTPKTCSDKTGNAKSECLKRVEQITKAIEKHKRTSSSQ